MSDQAKKFFLLAGLLALSAIIVQDFWNGYLAEWDDEFYIRGILGWVTDPPHVGSTHWELRHPYTLLTAASVAVFGVSEPAVVLPSLAAFWGLVALVYWAALKRFGLFTAGSLAALLLTLPLLNIYGTVLRADMLEALFVVASLTAFLGVILHGYGERWLVAAGAFAGLAFITRETSGALIVFYALLFLAGYGGSRRRYFWMLAGFLPVWLIEYLFLLYHTGDPLYRYVIDLAQHHPLRPENVLSPPPAGTHDLQEAYRLLGGGEQKYAPTLPAASILDLGGLNPVAQFFMNHEYSISFFIAVPAWLYLAFAKGGDKNVRTLARLLGLFALLWFLIVAYGLVGRPKPNYFLPVLISAAAILALTLFRLRARGWRTLTFAGLASILVVNFLSMEIHQYRPTYSGRILAQVATEIQGPVYTDVVTAKLGNFFLASAGVTDRVRTNAPPPGALFLYDEDNVTKKIADPEVQGRYRPEPEWEVLEAFERRERLPGAVMRFLGMDDLLTPRLLDRLSHPEPRVVLYRVR